MNVASAQGRRWLMLIAVAAIAGYLAVAIGMESQRLGQGLARLGLGGITLVLGLSLLNYGLRCWRWAVYLQRLGHRLPVLRHAGYYFGGFAFTVSPGKAGEALRGVYLRQHGVPWSHTLAALFTERLLDVLAICALIALTTGQLEHWRGLGLAIGACVLLLVWLLGRPGLPDALDRLSHRLLPRLAHAMKALSSLLRASAQLLSLSQLLPALLLGMLAWGAEGYGLYWLAQSLGLDLSVQAGIAIYSIGVLAGALTFFMPGGLGGVEAAMTALLVAAGSDVASAFVITVLCRFATLWLAVLLGLAALLWLEWRLLATVRSQP
ncbi:MAG: lysylphosphatidylglycerol synthase transmembrane domain-containing protein [Pseudomonadota bacterium]